MNRFSVDWSWTDRSITEEPEPATATSFAAPRITRKLIDENVPQFSNSSSVPWVADYYEPGHDKLDASSVCRNQGNGLQVLIMVTSATDHAEARMGVRLTWGAMAKRTDVGLGFLLATSLSSAVQRAVEDEAVKYGDIIRGHSVDAYDNLTLKSLSMLEWVGRHCARAPFVLKTDDDMFINVANLLSFTASNMNASRAIFGDRVHGWKPERKMKNKWRVPEDQFRPDVYPDFTIGQAYLLTSDTVRDLYQAAMGFKYFKLEDVFLTGVVADAVNVTRVKADGFLNNRTPAVSKLDHCALAKSISYHKIGNADKFNLWAKLFGIREKCGSAVKIQRTGLSSKGSTQKASK